MQISIEQEKCISCGFCEQKCPGMFKIMDSGKPEILKSNCCESQCECKVEEVIKGCPAEAIKIIKL